MRFVIDNIWAHYIKSNKRFSMAELSEKLSKYKEQPFKDLEMGVSLICLKKSTKPASHWREGRIVKPWSPLQEFLLSLCVTGVHWKTLKRVMK